MKNLISLDQIREARPCKEGWSKLLAALGNPSKDQYCSIKVSIGDIAKSNDAQDALWCTRCLPKESRRDVVRAILPAVKRAAKHTSDTRVHDCITAVEQWIGGDNAVDLIAARAAAYAAARVADAADAADAAYAAARAAAYAADAARAAARAAAYAADAAAETKQQSKDIIEVFPLHTLLTEGTHS